MKINAIAPYFGGKRTLAPVIVQQLGPHRAYWEPFCGSMAVLMAKPECSQETVNDLFGDLVNLARVVRHCQWGPWLYRRLRRTLASEDLFREAAALLKAGGHPVAAADVEPSSADPHRAYAFFIASWLGRNGVIGTRQWNNNFCVRYTLNGGIQGTRFASAVDSIPAWRRRLREVTILSRNGFDLLENIADQAGVAIYADPPYLRDSRLAKNAQGGRSGSALYLHEFESADHERLALLLRRFTHARVVVSYYMHEQLAALYPGWTVFPCPVAKALVQQGKRGSKKQIAPEVLILNGPAHGQSSPGLFTEGA